MLVQDTDYIDQNILNLIMSPTTKIVNIAKNLKYN